MLFATIATQAFAHDHSYGHFFPWRHEFPQDFYDQVRNSYHWMLVTPGQLIMVLEVTSRDLPRLRDAGVESHVGKVAAFATLVRSGGSFWERWRWNWDTPAKGTPHT